jgi:CRISPR/Cas system-associated exonuclease Cas4 (RecB family)
MTYSLSPTSLNLFVNCPRCFWLSVAKKVPRPSIPMPSIVNRFDGIVKDYFNRYRALGELPPIIAWQVKGRLPRGMPTSLRHEEDNGVLLLGRPDDYLQLEDGTTVPFDHKTRASPPDGTHPAHRLQLDVYTYLLGKSGYETVDKAYLAYYYPEDSDLHDGMRIGCTVVEVITNPARVQDLLLRACDVLNGPIPDPKTDCKYCKWVSAVQNESILFRVGTNAQ